VNEPKKPQIEFPCQYPIKVMGSAGPELYQHILRVMDAHAPGYKASEITIKNSNKGNWQSITVVITATGKPQLDALFADLKTSTTVKMVL
jgi:putative lipoic acid-binding regulatory protein